MIASGTSMTVLTVHAGNMCLDKTQKVEKKKLKLRI